MKDIVLFIYLLAFSFSFSQSDYGSRNQIDNFNTVASNNYSTKDILNAFNKANQARQLSDSLNDDYGSALANFTLGKLYMHMHKHENAKSSFLRMQKHSKQIKDNYLTAVSYFNIGLLNSAKTNSLAAVPFFKEANTYALKIKNDDGDNTNNGQSLLFQININLSALYLENNKLNDATFYLLSAQDNLAKLSSNHYYKSQFNYYYGDLYLKRNLYNLANDKFEIALNTLKQEKENLDNNLLLSKIYKAHSISLEKTGHSDLAYAMLKLNDYKRERYINEEKRNQETIFDSKLNIELYKQDAKWANEGRSLQEKITQEAKNFNTYITFTALLLLVLFVGLFIIYASKRKLSKILVAQNKKLEIAKEMAEESSRLKTKFISNVSHELRTPLYGVVGLTSLMLKNNNFSARDTKYLKSLKYSGDYLLNLINDILQAGKIESNTFELNNVSVKLKSLIQNIVDSFEYRLEESNNQIHISYDEGLPEFVECDKIRLTQILFNLIGNSIKFTENGNIFVKVILLNSAAENVQIRFEVEDDGMGIPKDKQTVIFENFSQLNENININYQGTGLGLSVTKKLVELFDSKIELESDLGLGSTFSFNVSFKIDHKAIEDQKRKSTSNVFSASNSKNYKILIAEDNKINQIVTSNLLTKENYKFDIAQNGLEALNAFKCNKYDLILMDINMPIMDGNEATIEIKKLDSEIPIVALTASSADEVRKNKTEIGFDDIITKPFDNELFFKTISKLIEGKKATFTGVKVLELAS
ncbi:MAG TPA: response regulator [Yeosuana sp.]